MRNLIKTIIALAFILGGYIIGKYQADEKCAVQLKELNEKAAIDKKCILQLEDSMSLFKMEILRNNSANLIDTIGARLP